MAAIPNPTPPPIAHLFRPAVDLYKSPVAVPAKIVLISSSSPRVYCNRTPKPEYITVNAPSVFAVAEPCFTKWFNSLCSMREIEKKYYVADFVRWCYTVSVSYQILTVFVVIFHFAVLQSLHECHCISPRNHLESRQSVNYKNDIYGVNLLFALVIAWTYHNRRANLWECQFKSSSLFRCTFGKYEFWLRLL